MYINVSIEVSVENEDNHAAVLAQLGAVLDRGVSEGEIDDYTILED